MVHQHGPADRGVRVAEVPEDVNQAQVKRHESSPSQETLIGRNIGQAQISIRLAPSSVVSHVAGGWSTVQIGLRNTLHVRTGSEYDVEVAVQLVKEARVRLAPDSDASEHAAANLGVRVIRSHLGLAFLPRAGGKPQRSLVERVRHAEAVYVCGNVWVGGWVSGWVGGWMGECRSVSVPHCLTASLPR